MAQSLTGGLIHHSVVMKRIKVYSLLSVPKMNDNAGEKGSVLPDGSDASSHSIGSGADHSRVVHGNIRDVSYSKSVSQSKHAELKSGGTGWLKL